MTVPTPSAARSSPRGGVRWLLRALLLGEIAAAVFLVARQAPMTWQQRWVQDDAYVSFRYAHNLVRGHGLVYNPGARVEGYSNFLWTVLAALPLARGASDPLPFMHAAGFGCWLLSYLLLLLLGVRLFRQGVWIAPLALAPLTYHWSFNLWFVSGMETPLVTLLTIAAVFFLSLEPTAHGFGPFAVSLTAVALAMARPDGIVTAAALALAGLVLWWRPLLHKNWVVYFWGPLLPIVTVYAPYQLWRVWYYGSFFPNTYYAKVAYLPFYARGWEYLQAYLDTYQCAPFLAAVIAGALAARAGAAQRFLIATLLATAFVFFHVVRLGGDFMEWRFLMPVSGVLYPAAAVGAAVCGERAWAVLRAFSSREHLGQARAAGLLTGLGVLGVLALVTERAAVIARDVPGPQQETIGLLRRYCDPRVLNWGAVGQLFDEVLPHTARIATTSAGIIPFYCDRPCLDLHGLTDPEIAHSPVDPYNRGRTGHEHWLQDFNRMRQRGVDIYLPWAQPKAVPNALLTPPQDAFETVSARLPNGLYVDFVILNHHTVDRTALRSDRRLVFFGDVPLVDRKELHSLRYLLYDHRVVDTLDLEEVESQLVHAFTEVVDRQRPVHNFHEKILPYRVPLDLLMVDTGRRIADQAQWTVTNVTAGEDLLLVVRYDHSGGSGQYRLEVNGQSIDGLLEFPHGPELWDEAVLRVPATVLLTGANTFRLIRLAASPFDAELYFMWFLQPSKATADK
ncbi:MAG: hypothetical protein HY699_25075 [Deltaproteobacteria bacterium]|nr:hypothetical protein [Deltaproteobacteria bacterium]